MSLSTPLAAQDTNWTNPGTGDWFTSGNWSAGVPASFLMSEGIINNGGTAIISAGNASSYGFHIANDSATSGTLQVVGAGSTLTVISDFNIGRYGAGTLNILNGGAVSNSLSFIGKHAGSVSTVTVDGAGSTWTHNNNIIIVGYEGTGTLNIQNGGKVISPSVVLGQDGLGSGTLNIGTGGIAGLLDTATVNGGPGTAVLNFNHSNAAYYFTRDGTAEGVAVVITGTTRVNQIGSGRTILLGTNSYSGITTVTAGTLQFAGEAALYGGNQANWTKGNIMVSSGATLAFNVGGAGEFTAGDITTLLTNLTTGVNSNGLQAGSRIGFDTTGGDFQLNDGITDSTGIAGFGSLGVTKLGSNALTLTGASTYTDDTIVKEGSLIFSGTGSLNGAGSVIVGNDSGDNGTLRIENGAAITSTYTGGFIGFNAGSTGMVTVTGTDSTWTNSSSSIYVGFYGNGTLKIENGGRVTDMYGHVNVSAGSTGMATVTGKDSTWTNISSLYVGGAGSGTLNIADGGTVTNLTGIMGNDLGSTGMATVTGTDSTWTNSIALYVGYFGSGTLSIENAGLVNVNAGTGVLELGFSSDATGTLNIGNGAAAGVLNAGSVNGGSGTAVLNFNHTDADYYFTKDGTASGAAVLITGSTSVNHLGSGKTTLTGNNTYTGNTVINNGILSFTGNSVLTGTMTVEGVGLYGSQFGQLQVLSGGQLTTGEGFVGTTAQGKGVAVVDGPGSKWTVNGDLHVSELVPFPLGGSGGTLRVDHGATVQVNGLLDVHIGGVIEFGEASSITATGGMKVIAGTIRLLANTPLNIPDIDIGAVSATIDTNGFNTSFGGSVSSASIQPFVKKGAGTLVLTSDQPLLDGTVYVEAGTLAGGSFSNAALRVAGGNYSPGNVGTVQTVTFKSLSLEGGGLLMDLAAGGVSDHLTVTDGLAAITAPALFTFNDLGAEQTTYHLIDGLDISNPWDTSLLSFTGLGGDAIGSFYLSDDLSELLFYLIPSGIISGPLLQNSSPINIPTNATFLVNGAAQTGGANDNNTIKALFFNPGSSLQVFNNLTVTNGYFTVNSGRASINGGRVIVPGDFNKNGGGTLVLNTFLQAGGIANINQGALFVNGTLAADRVNVFRGALLGGSGIVFGDVFNSGTVAPGNSPGTLTIIGNYTQTRFGTLQIEIASETVYDRLVVSGTARLDGTLDIRNYHGNTLSYGQQVPFLQAGKIVGRFDEIMMPEEDRFRGRFLNAGNVGILLVAPTSYTLVAETPNQTRVAQALDRWIGIEDGDIGEVTLALDLLTTDQYPAAFEAIMPGYYEAALSTGIELSQNQGQMLFQQLSSRRLGAKPRISVPASAAPISAKGAKNVAPVQPQVAVTEELHWNAWMQGSGLFSEGGLSLNPGEDFDSGTLMVGADFAVSEHVSLGVFASYQEGWGDYDNGGDIDLESVRFGGYATFDFDGFYASAAVGGGTTDYSVKRPIQWATLDRSARSDPEGTEFFTLLGTGYDFHAGNFTFGLSLSAQYTKLKLDEFTETGANTLDLRIRDAEEESLRTYFGGRIAYTLKVNDGFTVIPELRAFWEHEFLQGGENLNASLNGGSGPEFKFVTEEPGKDAMYVGAGLNFEFGEDFTTSVYYHANFGRNDDAQHTVSVSANWKF